MILVNRPVINWKKRRLIKYSPLNKHSTWRRIYETYRRPRYSLGTLMMIRNKVLFEWMSSYEVKFPLRFPDFSLYLRFHHRRGKIISPRIKYFRFFVLSHVQSLDLVKTALIQQWLLSNDGQELGEGSVRLLICTSVALDLQVRKPALMAVHYTWARVTCAGDDSSLSNALIVDSSSDVSRINDFSPC